MLLSTLLAFHSKSAFLRSAVPITSSSTCRPFPRRLITALRSLSPPQHLTVKYRFLSFSAPLLSLCLFSLVLHSMRAPPLSPCAASKMCRGSISRDGKNSSGWTEEKRKTAKLVGDPRMNSGHGRGPFFSWPVNLAWTSVILGPSRFGRKKKVFPFRDSRLGIRPILCGEV